MFIVNISGFNQFFEYPHTYYYTRFSILVYLVQLGKTKFGRFLKFKKNDMLNIELFYMINI